MNPAPYIPATGPKSGRPLSITLEIAEKFNARVMVRGDDECWPWQGAIKANGYGWMGIGNRKSALAHRIAVLLDGRYIPPTFVVDHMCRNRLCVNPRHLRVVSARANTLENSDSPTSLMARQTHCKRGHELTPENVWVRFRSNAVTRNCRTCGRMHSNAWKKRRRAARRLAREANHV